MSAPEESFDIAVDDSNSAERRRSAIDDLRAANECARLANIVTRDDLDSEFREMAVSCLANPQCGTTLRDLLDDGEVPESLRDHAERRLQESPDDTGAGP